MNARQLATELAQALADLLAQPATDAKVAQLRLTRARMALFKAKDLGYLPDTGPSRKP
jgi:hypothetical protein